MIENRRLLIVDNDLHQYDIGNAVQRSVAQLLGEGFSWVYHDCPQADAKRFLSRTQYNALLIDNDAEMGLKTLVDAFEFNIPIAYVSCFTLEQLDKIYSEQSTRTLPIMFPHQFMQLGVKFMRKRDIVDHVRIRGEQRTVTSELVDEDGVTFDTLQREIYDFLKSVRS